MLHGIGFLLLHILMAPTGGLCTATGCWVHGYPHRRLYAMVVPATHQRRHSTVDLMGGLSAIFLCSFTVYSLKARFASS
jgi:hypothetical protein